MNDESQPDDVPATGTETDGVTLPDTAAAPSDAAEPETTASQGPSLSAATAANAAAEVAAEAPRRKPLLSRTGKIIAGIVSVVSFATGVIGVWPILFRDASGFSSLSVSAEPFASSALEFVLPADTDVSTFPVSDSACSADQLAWLQSNAVETSRRWLLDLRNVASEGGMLALTDFEALTTPSTGTTGIRVVCSPADSVDTVQAARLAADETGATALFEASAFGVSNEAIPDVPVAWNLAPGESGRIVLDVSSRVPLSGIVQLTVHSGKEQVTVPIEGLEFTIPGMVDGGRRYLVAAPSGLECHTAGSDELCDLAAVISGSAN